MSSDFANQGDRLVVETTTTGTSFRSAAAFTVDSQLSRSVASVEGGAKPQRSMLAAWVAGDEADEENEHFIYSHPPTRSSTDTDTDNPLLLRVPLNQRLRNPPTRLDSSTTSHTLLPPSHDPSLAMPTPPRRKPSVKHAKHRSQPTPSSNYVAHPPSPFLNGSGSSAVSSLALGADFTTHQPKIPAKLLYLHQQQQRSSHQPHHPVYFDDGSGGMLSGNQMGGGVAGYYQRPVLQKRMRSSNSTVSSERSGFSGGVAGFRNGSGSLAVNGGVGASPNGGYFTVGSRSNTNRMGEGVIGLGIGNRSVASFSARKMRQGSANSSTASTGERTHLLSSNGGNLEIDAGGRVTVSVSVEDDCGNSVGSRRHGGNRNNGGVLQKQMTLSSFCTSFFLILIAFLALVLLISNPLTPLAPSDKSRPWILPTDTWHPHVTNISAASAQIYAVDFELMAVNWGIMWDVVLGGADLEVFVEASGETSDLPRDGNLSSQELLAHLSVLDKPAIFPPHSVTLNATARLAIDHPSSTVGKIIYMNYPYKLTLKGSLRYTSAFGIYTSAFPVCSVHLVEARDVISSRECGT
ncbi:hypothetical protein HDU98_000375 [Podochytrium sp. JEL0797]|nr:hypothetical protein HDU98_000375 [Podochytrium sp. JEL0797]